MKEGLSIIIAAYNTAEYIQETLDSIQNQDWCMSHNNYEILIGIDGCQKTLQKVKEIMGNYKNLIVYYMSENMGTFVTANTLISLSQYNKILRFDSDDMLLSESLSKIMDESKNADIIRYWYRDYISAQNIKNMNLCAYGSVLYDKKVFEKAGGYKDWKCSGDYEFFQRVQKHFKVKELHDYIYYHRIRNNSLMTSAETSMNSEYRRKLNKTVRTYNINENIFIEPKINDYIIINHE